MTKKLHYYFSWYNLPFPKSQNHNVRNYFVSLHFLIWSVLFFYRCYWPDFDKSAGDTGWDWILNKTKHCWEPGSPIWDIFWAVAQYTIGQYCNILMVYFFLETGYFLSGEISEVDQAENRCEIKNEI